MKIPRGFIESTFSNAFLGKQKLPGFNRGENQQSRLSFCSQPRKILPNRRQCLKNVPKSFRSFIVIVYQDLSQIRALHLPESHLRAWEERSYATSKMSEITQASKLRWKSRYVHRNRLFNKKLFMETGGTFMETTPYKCWKVWSKYFPNQGKKVLSTFEKCMKKPLPVSMLKNCFLFSTLFSQNKQYHRGRGRWWISAKL